MEYYKAIKMSETDIWTNMDSSLKNKRLSENEKVEKHLRV